MDSKDKKTRRKKRPPPSKKTADVEPIIELPGADEHKHVRQMSKKLTKVQLDNRTDKLVKGALDVPVNEDGTVEATGYDYLRRLAEVVYITAQSDISIRGVSELPDFKGRICYATLAQYCISDKWVEQRKAYRKGLQEKLKQKLATAQVQSRLDHLEKYAEIFSVLFNSMDEVQPNSLEGVTTALVRVGKFMEELRTLVAAEVVPEQWSTSQEQGAPVPPVLSPDEARAAAMTIVKMRQQTAKTENPEDTDSEGVE